MSELFNREDFLKNLIKRIHDDPENLEKVKEDFMRIVREMTPIEVAKIEQELVNEGMPAESIQLMCNIHLDVFKEALSEDEIDVEPWHPLHILVEEHRDILNRSKELRGRAGRIKNGDLTQSDIQAMANLLDYMDEVEKYFLKEENVLDGEQPRVPYLWQNLQEVFPDYHAEELKVAGLVIDNEAGRRYDRFRDRLMIPIINQKGDIIAFGGRIIDQGEPKYLNSPETPLFEKGRELFGLPQAPVTYWHQMKTCEPISTTRLAGRRK